MAARAAAGLDPDASQLGRNSVRLSGDSAVTRRLQVVPARRGGWRVEDMAGVQHSCATRAEAEVHAERLIRDAGGGEIFIYDARSRLLTVKRLGPLGRF